MAIDMQSNDWSEFDISTAAVRAGHERTHEGEHSEAIFSTSSFVFGSAAEAAARFQNKIPGNVYSRFTNPTVRTFEQRLAAMEGGECCVATSSGMAAIMATCVAIADWRDKIKPETKMLFLETPTNPLTQLADIRALATLANENDCLLVVDNCFCTPVLQRPIELGAHLVIHSATKFIDGQGRCVGGAVVGDKQLVGEEIFGFLRTAGPTMSPFNAWVFLKGLETLEIRMQRHCQSAAEIAVWLQQQPSVTKVYYPGLTDHPQHELCKAQQTGFGGIVSSSHNHPWAYH